MKQEIKCLLTAGAGLASFADGRAETVNVDRPNFLVIVCEDISPYLGCYGDGTAVSPNIDRFAGQGILHSRMFTCVGVSSPSRYSLITGRYASTDGANYMRVNLFNKDFETVPPDGVKCFTEYLRKEGYYCTNNSKTDYQFTSPVAAWDENGAKAHWKNAPQDQPFFSIFNLNVTHESQIWKNTDRELAVNPDSVSVPPYYPDTPTVRHDIAVMYSNVKLMDAQFQKLLDELEASQRSGNTIVVFYSDNGGPLPRAKRELMDSGTLVPFIIRFPDGKKAGTVCNGMNMFVDIPATFLSLAGIRPPENMHGRAMYGKYKGKAREYVFGATDRFDEQVEKRGAIRSGRYLYIRNYMPQQSVYRPVKYRLQMEMMKEMVRLREEGRLEGAQNFWFESPAPSEALYDCQCDPHNILNLASDRKYSKVLEKMRKAYREEWIEPYNIEWESEDEGYFTGKAWKEGAKPVCENPDVKIEDGTLTVGNDRSIYSISFKSEGDSGWTLYTGPVSFCRECKVRVRVERIGYTPSETELEIK